MDLLSHSNPNSAKKIHLIDKRSETVFFHRKNQKCRSLALETK